MTTLSGPERKAGALGWNKVKKSIKLECGPMPNLMVALPNIGGALCSTPQSLALLECRAVTLAMYDNARLERKVNFHLTKFR